jgi:hypothetical protein
VLKINYSLFELRRTRDRCAQRLDFTLNCQRHQIAGKTKDPLRYKTKDRCAEGLDLTLNCQRHQIAGKTKDPLRYKTKDPLR